MSPSTSEAGPRPGLRVSARTCAVVGVVLLVIGVAMTRPAGPIGRAVTDGTDYGSVAPVYDNVTLNLTDAPSFGPNNLSVAAGALVKIELHNVGSYNHSFTLANQSGKVLNTSWDPVELDHYFSVNASQANVTLAPGGTRTVNLSFPARDAGASFEFTSIVPYQLAAGMLGYLNVTGPPSGPGEVLDVATSSTQLAFLPAVLAVNVSSYPVTVDIAVSNLGSNAHTFWLESQPNETLNPGNFSSYFQANPPLADVAVPTSPGAVVWANFTVKGPGVYEFICTIPGHFAAGMDGNLYVGVPPPAVSAPPSTEIVSVWVLWGGAAILAVGTLLAAAGLLVGRFPRPPPSAGH